MPWPYNCRQQYRLCCCRREDPMKTWKLGLATVLVLALAFSGAALGQTLERKQLALGVGGKTALYYLPLTICERFGYFKEQGLDVALNDFPGGAHSRPGPGRGARDR